MASLNDLNSFTKQIHKALRAWREPGSPETLLASLLLVQEQANANQDENPALQRLATNAVLLEGMDELQVQDEQLAYVLQQRFPGNKSILMVKNQLNVSEHSVSRYQRAGIERLAEIIYAKESALREKRIQEIETYMPPPAYTQLFGFDELAAEMKEMLLRPSSPWLTALVGLGGIGKTALADSIARQIIREFHYDDVAWVQMTPLNMGDSTADPNAAFSQLIASLAGYFFPDPEISGTPDGRLMQVRQHLKNKSILVIVDNLESEAETALLISKLADLAEPSKFLLTARVRPPTQAAIWTVTVNELDFTNAKALMQRQAQDTGVRALTSAEAEDYESIYAVTGGNPLALKLVVGLLDVLPLDQVLSGLELGQKGEIEKMYNHIYWKTWNTLSENGRSLLMAMPIVSNSGGTQGYLQTLSGLKETDLWPAVQELRSRSLLEVRGSIKEKRYGIHRLTETFLHTEIVDWSDDG